MNHKKLIIVGVIILLFGTVMFIIFKPKSDEDKTAKIKPTPKPEPVNIIANEKRPYITLEPQSGRNQLNFVLHNLIITADSLEITLNYDRNKGVEDAVLRDLPLSKLPFVVDLFLGSKSAGGHITYHEDVIGGSLHLEFRGDESYALEVPWRYDDTQTEYSQLSTADQKFQIELEKPYQTPKIVVMQSPGLPKSLDNEILSGPFLFRGLGRLPDTTATVKLRLNQESTTATLYGYDGQDWHQIESTYDAKLVTGTGPVYELYVVTK
jgi:hypothetical protein